VVSTAKAAAATKAIFIIGASFLSSITDNVDEHERFHPFAVPRLWNLELGDCIHQLEM
jgi:hypothetical protein